MPNAGKSTLLRAVSAARPKVANYPFTTLVPGLGVVSIELERSFVMADIPGVIEGASVGAGLGFQFLKHLSRTRLLLHLVDAAPLDDSDPIEQIQAIADELAGFSQTLYSKPRWLVLNKADMSTDADLADLMARLRQTFGEDVPIYTISAISGEGCAQLCQEIMVSVEQHRQRLKDDEQYRDEEAERDRLMTQEIRASIAEAKAQRKAARQAAEEDGLDDDEDDDAAEWEYAE